LAVIVKDTRTKQGLFD